jgi:hypothetical protein
MILAALLATAVPLEAQVTTGTIRGRVTDSATGEPLTLAQVTVLGTTLGNFTNEDGFYFLNEVPAGLQDVEARVLGYRPFTIETQRILAGQSTTLNFELEQTAIELQPLVVEGERNPLVPRDQISSKAIVEGRLVDVQPVDNVSEIVVLQPGVYEELGCADDPGPDPVGCISIRGGRPNEEAVYIDGVLVRSMGTGRASNVQVPTNSLEQLDVIVGAFSAEFGGAQSGIISYVTRTGGSRYTGALEFQTDQLGPNDWRTNFNRLELNFGGPIVGPLGFFLAGTATGQDWFQNEGLPSEWVVDGVDTCPSDPRYAGLCEPGQPATFRMPRSSASGMGIPDSVDVGAPYFVPWDNGRTTPSDFSDNLQFTANLNYQLPRGSRVNLGYTRNRYQNYYRGGWYSQFLTEGVDGERDTRDVLTLSSFITLAQSATQQIALDIRASYQASRYRAGLVDGRWFNDNQDPFLGFTLSDVRFNIDEDLTRYGMKVFHPSDEFVHAYRSGALSPDSLALYPDKGDQFRTRETVPGVDTNLRSNPWGWYYGYPITGIGNAGYTVRDENSWQVRGSLDWQIGRFNRLKLGGEYLSADLNRVEFPLAGGQARPELARPVQGGLFLQNRLDVGDLVLEGGLRWDYFDPDVEFTRVPGYEANVPDSLQANFVRWDAASQAFVPKFDAPCGGPTASNPEGICLDNYLPGETRSEWSPRLGAAFPVTPTSTFRLSYGRFVQVPAFFSGAGYNFSSNTAASQANLMSLSARDVELPDTRTFEFGYRQLFGSGFVFDIAAFNKKQRRALTYRLVTVENPNTGAPDQRTILTNQDFTESLGFEVKMDGAFGNLFMGNLSYSYLDARGTGTDPWTYLDLVDSQRSNLSFLTGDAVEPPEVLLPLELGRQHNIGLTTSLYFPPDYQEGTTAGAILRDLGVFALLSMRSGQRFTGLEYQGGYGDVGPPSSAGPASTPIGALQTPWQTRFDIKLTKAFQLGKGWRLQAYIDWRNPFDIAVTETVFLDTGNPVNEQARARLLNDALADPRLDGDNDIRDFDIVAESPETDFNKFMLLRAEERWGNGDGIFTVEEQERSFGQEWEYGSGLAAFVPSNQSLRLGLRISL